MIKKIFYWSTLAFVFAIPLWSEASVRLMILALLLSFFVKEERSPLIDIFNLGWDILALFVVMGLGLFYTRDLATGYGALETSFSLLAAPFIVNKARYAFDRFLVKVFIAFSVGLSIACIISLAVATYNYSLTHDIHVFFSYALTDSIRSHPTYLAYYLIFSITVGSFLLYYNEATRMKIMLATMIIFFFIVLMLTGGRTAFVSLLLMCSFFALKWLLEPGTRWKNVVFGMVCFMIAGSFMVNSAEFWGQKDLAIENDYWERSVLWESAMRANPNIVFGVGTGDYKIMLNEYYLSHGLIEFAHENLNAHNQFIEIYLSNGLIGLACLLLLIGRPLYLAMQNQNTLGILIIYPFIIYGMNEVFLGRFQGVVFFALLHQLVVSQFYSGKPSALLKPA